MANKADGTPQAQHGGRKHGSKAKLKLQDAADPMLLIESKYGPGTLLKKLTPEQKVVFQEATSIAYERWVETTQQNVRRIVGKLLERLEENIDKIPPSYLTLNAVQLMSQLQKGQVPSGPQPTQHLHLHGTMTVESIKAQLFGPDKGQGAQQASDGPQGEPKPPPA